MPKETEAEKITLEEATKIIEGATKKKKPAAKKKTSKKTSTKKTAAKRSTAKKKTATKKKS